MSSIVRFTERSVVIAASGFVDLYVVKKSFEALNFVVSKVFKTSRPEQFVKNQIYRLPPLAQRSLQLLTWKNAVIAGVALVILSWIQDECDRRLGEIKWMDKIVGKIHPLIILDNVLP